jgi:hypothetical protein
MLGRAIESIAHLLAEHRARCGIEPVMVYEEAVHKPLSSSAYDYKPLRVPARPSLWETFSERTRRIAAWGPFFIM